MLDSKNSHKPGPCSGTGTARLQSLLLICIQPHEGKKQHLGKEAGIMRRRSVPRQHRVEFVEFFRWCVFAGKARGALDATYDS
jgi:hypothetical protein